MRPAASALAVIAITATSGDVLAADRVTMPYFCTALGSGAVELDPAPGPQTYAILGPRSAASYRHCAPGDPTRCKSWKVHRFDVDCNGKAVPWYRIVAAASEITGGPASLDGTRLRLRMRPDGSGADDIAVMPPGFAPVVGLTAEIGGGDLAGPMATAKPLAAPAAEAAPPAPVAAGTAAKPKVSATPRVSDAGGSGTKAGAVTAPPPAASAAPSPSAPATPQPSPPGGPKLAPGVIALPSPPAGNRPTPDGTKAIQSKVAEAPSSTPPPATPPPSPAPAPAAASTATTPGTTTPGSPAAGTTAASTMAAGSGASNATPPALPASAPDTNAVAGPAGVAPAVVDARAPRVERPWAIALLSGAALAAVALIVRLMSRRRGAVARARSPRPRSPGRDLAAPSLAGRATASDDIQWKPARTAVFSPPAHPAAPREPVEPSLPLPQAAASPPVTTETPPEPPADDPALPIELPTTRAEALEMLGAPADASLDAARKIVEGLRLSWSPDLAKSPDDRLKREAHIRAIDAVWAVAERTPPLEAI